MPRPVGADGTPTFDTLPWSVDPAVLQDALAQARPFTGQDETAEDRAWTARVDAAVQGMDVIDPDGLTKWEGIHAAAEKPHMTEAGLVATWETFIRQEFAEAHDGADAALADWSGYDLDPTADGDADER